MPLTKSEFDKLWGERNRAALLLCEKDKALQDRPSCLIAGIVNDGWLETYCATKYSPEETRSLYEMLRAWYGESSMTEKAKAVIEVADAIATADGILQRDAWHHFVRTVSAYRAEQKQ